MREAGAVGGDSICNVYPVVDVRLCDCAGYFWIGGIGMLEESIREAADRLGYKPLKSDNIVLGGVIPLPDGRKAAVVEEVESIGNKGVQTRSN